MSEQEMIEAIKQLEQERNELADQFPRLDLLIQTLSRSHDALIADIRKAAQEKQILLQQLRELEQAAASLKFQLDEAKGDNEALVIKLCETKSALEQTEQAAMKERKENRKRELLESKKSK